MPLPKFNQLSPAIQFAVVGVLGAALWMMTEYFYPNLEQVRSANKTKATHVVALTKEVVPLRPFRDKVRALEVDNKQLENQLENLSHIVPNEKEVDNFVRLLQSQGLSTGVQIRRVSAKAPVTQQYYVEVPFEIELDGPFYDVLQFYDRLGKVERITNVSDLKMDGLQTSQSGGGKYNYSPGETVVAVCTVTTFFSRAELFAEAQTTPTGKAPAGVPARRAAATVVR